MKTELIEKPCLVNAKQGFSVYYKNRFLYSKYNPSATIEKAIEQTALLNETLILICSPVLWLGFEKLLEKAPQNCVILAIENDKALYDFSLENTDFGKTCGAQSCGGIASKTSGAQSRGGIASKTCGAQSRGGRKIFFRYYENLEVANSIFQESEFQNAIRSCKRITKFDFCAIESENKIFYENFSLLASQYIQQFWKNRMTISKLGKLYSKNIFENLTLLPKSQKLIEKSVSKPILVFGAGPSVDDFFNSTTLSAQKINENFFVICVDHALNGLLERKINVDIIVAVESQLANEKAFIGILGKQTKPFTLVADLTSRPNITKYILKNAQNQVSFIFTEYEKRNFLSEIYEKFPLLKFAPMGSVGLYAMQLALFLRKTDATPIFFAGLDFSFPCGKTHCNSSSAHKRILQNCQKLSSLENVSASFRIGAKQISKSIYTDMALEGYAKDFVRRFSQKENLYNLSAIKLGTIQNVSPTEFDKFAQNAAAIKPNTTAQKTENCTRNEAVATTPNTAIFTTTLNISTNEIQDYISEKITLLEKTKNALQTGSMETSEILSLIDKLDFLYAHFPDGNAECKNEISFLKRVRNEIDVYLKLFTLL